MQKKTEAGATVTVISSDKDLMQLVSKVRLFDPMKCIWVRKVLGLSKTIK